MHAILNHARAELAWRFLCYHPVKDQWLIFSANRTCTLWESSPFSFISRTARCDAAEASSVIFAGLRVLLIALRKKALAAVTSRVRLKKKRPPRLLCPTLFGFPAVNYR